jgi:hypothetical protein
MSLWQPMAMLCGLWQPGPKGPVFVSFSLDPPIVAGWRLYAKGVPACRCGRQLSC